MTKLNIKEMNITDIQFFDHSHPVQIGENEFATRQQYSANIVFDGKLLVQLSGNEDEAHGLYIPSSNEQYWDDAETQDLACEELDYDDVNARLDELGIENNFNFLSENATETI